MEINDIAPQDLEIFALEVQPPVFIGWLEFHPFFIVRVYHHPKGQVIDFLLVTGRVYYPPWVLTSRNWNSWLGRLIVLWESLPSILVRFLRFLGVLGTVWCKKMLILFANKSRLVWERQKGAVIQCDELLGGVSSTATHYRLWKKISQFAHVMMHR